MRKYYTVGLAFAAVFAFLAIAATSALAATAEWLVEGNAVTVNLPAETEGLLFLTKFVSAANHEVLQEIDCSGIFDGTIGPAGKDEISDLLNLEMEAIGELGMTNELALSCEATKSKSSLEDCPVGALVELTVVHLNLELGLVWLTQLQELTESGGIVLASDEFTAEGATPGYDVMCNDSIGVLGEETCTGNALAFLSNEPGTTPASVLGAFTGIPSLTANCTGTGEASSIQATGPNEAGHTWATNGTDLTGRLATAIN